VSEHLTRKELRTDRFAIAVGHNVEYLAEHRKQMVRYGGIALLAIVAGLGVYYFRSQQVTTRESALFDAIQIQETPVTPGVAPGPLAFPTDTAKQAAAAKAFSAIATGHSGTREGWIAEYYLGCIASDAGKLDEARKRFQSVAGGADKDYASLASFSLAEIDYTENKTADAEKILRQIIANPTVLVSKDQATVTLARHLSRTNPAEAKKLLQPLVSQANAASQVAISVLGEIKN
jgi:predicted negative regulator of RcsB-dependent stress response